MKWRILQAPLLLIALFLHPVPARSQGTTDSFFNRYYVRVRRDNVNIRARANTSSEVMDQAPRGSDLLVIGESGSWLQVQPRPEKAFAYVHRDMVQEGLIARTNVNFRAGPSLGQSILGKLAEGDPVLVVASFEDWLQIEMPRGFGFWISKNLTRFLCPENDYQEFIQNEKEAEKKFNTAENNRREELKKRFNEVDHDGLIRSYQQIVDAYPGTTEAKKAMERIFDLQEKKAMARQKQITFDERRRMVSLYDEAEDLRQSLVEKDGFTPEKHAAAVEIYRLIAREYPGDKLALDSLHHLDELEKINAERMPVYREQKRYRETGRIRPYRGKGYPAATHRLTRGGGPFGGKTLCALYSSQVDLRAFERSTVILEGTIVQETAAETPYPLVEISRIQLKTP